MNSKRFFLALLFVFLTATSVTSAADKLSDMMRESGWENIIGIWVDPETNGQKHKTTYAWKLEDRVIEIISQQGEKKQVSLIGVNAKNGDVFHMGVDSDGGSSLGKWEMDGNGDAVLGLIYTTADGDSGSLNIRHHRVSEKEMTITLELGTPMTFTLVKVK